VQERPDVEGLHDRRVLALGVVHLAAAGVLVHAHGEEGDGVVLVAAERHRPGAVPAVLLHALNLRSKLVEVAAAHQRHADLLDDVQQHRAIAGGGQGRGRLGGGGGRLVGGRRRGRGRGGRGRRGRGAGCGRGAGRGRRRAGGRRR